MAVWNDSFTGRGAVRMRTSSPFERHVFAKPYFDPEGLIVADEDGACVGFAHAGFGPDAEGAAVATAAGVTCLVAVRATHRRRGIGSELLRRAEEYLRQRGAQELFAGPQSPLGPFYLGMYGGSDLPGLLASVALAEPFLAHHGYCPCRTVLVFHKRLTQPLKVVDPRFVAHRQEYELREDPRARPQTWWRDCVFGTLEPLEFHLAERSSGLRVARALVWEMEGFSCLWNQPAVGLTDLEVIPERRRQGLARFLVTQLLRRIQEQFYEIVEAQAPPESATAALLLGLGFEQVDVGWQYRKE
jgi:ribosomal protein S18 acetylase RimI-like enzyme